MNVFAAIFVSGDAMSVILRKLQIAVVKFLSFASLFVWVSLVGLTKYRNKENQDIVPFVLGTRANLEVFF